MTDALEAQLAALIVGILATILWRLVDRYLPDPNVPLPPRPGMSGPPSSPPPSA